MTSKPKKPEMVPIPTNVLSDVASGEQGPASSDQETMAVEEGVVGPEGTVVMAPDRVPPIPGPAPEPTLLVDTPPTYGFVGMPEPVLTPPGEVKPPPMIGGEAPVEDQAAQEAPAQEGEAPVQLTEEQMQSIEEIDATADEFQHAVTDFDNALDTLEEMLDSALDK